MTVLRISGHEILSVHRKAFESLCQSETVGDVKLVMAEQLHSCRSKPTSVYAVLFEGVGKTFSTKEGEVWTSGDMRTDGAFIYDFPFEKDGKFHISAI